MRNIKHKFIDHKINPDTECLIVGTFNPDVEGNEATFFYGRQRNSLWKLLPIAYGEESLKQASLEEKIEFMKKHHVDFIDLIAEIEVEVGQEHNYDDKYIDSRVKVWTKIEDVIESLRNLKMVCITRKTFTSIPNLRKSVEKLQQLCADKSITSNCMITPSRFYNQQKQDEWNYIITMTHPSDKFTTN